MFYYNVPNIKYGLQDLNSSIAGAKCIFDLNTLSDLNNSDKQISDLNLNVTSFMVQAISQFTNIQIQPTISNTPITSFNATLESMKPNLESMCEQLVGKDQVLRNLSDIVYSFKRQISHMSIRQFLVRMHPQTKLV